MAASATTSSTTCGGFFSFRSSNSSDQSYRVRDSSSQTASAGCGGKLDGVAMWFVNGVTMAFFASLNRCSCIRIATKEDSEDANDLPLMFDDGNLRHDGVAAATTSRRRTGKGEKSGAVLVD
ncbi:unnamed protein product [Lathyrus oleraceus]|uniref:Uncharacterized protein n=1 Tax=Pisum sativum TaxID=3888 RepID=A0A9D4WJS0_PEA|nr:uncharacterized protein LOC127087995 [Pisum sativum]KAI5404144.1 hypothetical protein KIW84_051329 [Pisum sativum]